MPENSDWISCSGCENSRSSGEKPNFDPKPQKTRNDSSYQFVNKTNLIIGIRPKLIILSKEKSHLENSNCFEAKIINIHFMERENYIYYRFNDLDFVSVSSKACKFESGSKVYFSFEEKDIMFFDFESKINLLYINEKEVLK